eukprot:6205455-Pleurochrysis_carterae.AAC.1
MLFLQLILSLIRILEARTAQTAATRSATTVAVHRTDVSHNSRESKRYIFGSRAPKWVRGRALQRSALMEGYVGDYPRLDQMHPISSYVSHGACCHGCEDHDFCGLCALL